ncbi:MAG: ExbD/TolR family protein [Planctomycetota bacterium]
MRIAREEAEKDQVINISSLLDVMFILLIFFIATTTFKAEERDEAVSLPQTSESTSLTNTARKLIVINVRDRSTAEDGSLYLVSNRPMDAAAIQATVGDAISANPDQKVLVRGDKRALHGDVADAISACRAGGVAEVNIGYDFNPAGTP